MYHRSMVQGFFAAIFLFALFVGGNSIILNLRDYSYTSKIIDLLEEQDVFCRIVGDAQAEWPDEQGKRPDRVSVALGLYVANDIGLGCLEAEFDSRGLANQQDGLARLAKSFIYFDHLELSDLYLNSVCDAGHGAACKISQSMLSLDSGEIEEHRKQLLSVKDSDPVFAKLWAVDHLLDLQDYQAASDLLASIEKTDFLREALVLAETKLLWGLNGKQSSSGAAQVAFSLLPEDKKSGLASWLCYEELNSDCESWDSVSCEQFDKMVREDKEVLESTLAGITYINKKRCEDPDGVNYIALLASPLNSGVKELLVARRTEDADSFRNLAFDSRQNLRLRAEALEGLLQTSNNQDDFLRVQAHWLKNSRGPSFNKVGVALLKRYMRNRDYEQAVKVAERLEVSLPQLPKKSMEDYIMAEYYLGRTIKAKKILAKYKDLHPRHWISAFEDDERAPASASEFNMVVRGLR